MSNIINAIINLVENPVLDLKKIYSEKNRANTTGDSLEEYIKDLFAGTFDLADESDRLKCLSEVFSYLGNNSNPPDAMLKGGDAIEVKKIENNNSALALNSSYPKQQLYSNSTMISAACKNSEKWIKKDMIYAVGVVNQNKLKSLSMVYGLDYCASIETYERIKDSVKVGVTSIPCIEFAQTKELGRVNKIDPLGITYLRIRGMWGIENPWTVFKYVYKRDLSKVFNFMCLINENKWISLKNTKDLIAISNKDLRLNIIDVVVRNPDNPAQLKNAKLITFSF